MSELRPLYAVLDISANAPAEEIKAAYRRLALLHHPDKQCALQQAGIESPADVASTFARIAFAYEVLGDPQRRKRYDLTGEVPQTDAALGRSAGDTFLADFVKAAPKAPRGVTQKDMSLHSLENYEVLEVDGRDVPVYFRGIVMQGLKYLVNVVQNMEKKTVVLLRHYVMDQMYALLVYDEPLDESAFGERGYIITYYDHPLQAGITPTWSDQNEGRPRGVGTPAELLSIQSEVFEQRKLAALEWHGAAGAATQQTPGAGPTTVPGDGYSPERLRLAVRVLVETESDVGSFDMHRLRRELARLLDISVETLDSVRSSELMRLVFQEVDAFEESQETQEVSASPQVSKTPAPAHRENAPVIAKGTAVRVRQTGRVGEVLMHDPEDASMSFKLQFADGEAPAADWFSADAVDASGAAVAGA